MVWLCNSANSVVQVSMLLLLLLLLLWLFWPLCRGWHCVVSTDIVNRVKLVVFCGNIVELLLLKTHTNKSQPNWNWSFLDIVGMSSFYCCYYAVQPCTITFFFISLINRNNFHWVFRIFSYGTHFCLKSEKHKTRTTPKNARIRRQYSASSDSTWKILHTNLANLPHGKCAL